MITSLHTSSRIFSHSSMFIFPFFLFYISIFKKRRERETKKENIEKEDGQLSQLSLA